LGWGEATPRRSPSPQPSPASCGPEGGCEAPKSATSGRRVAWQRRGGGARPPLRAARKLKAPGLAGGWLQIGAHWNTCANVQRILRLRFRPDIDESDQGCGRAEGRPRADNERPCARLHRPHVIVTVWSLGRCRRWCHRSGWCSWRRRRSHDLDLGLRLEIIQLLLQVLLLKLLGQIGFHFLEGRCFHRPGIL
jgi:hypothetical protein